MNQFVQFLSKLLYSLPGAGNAIKAAGKRNDFELLVNSVLDYAIIMLDLKGNITTWNNGAIHITGYTAAEITGKSFTNFHSKEDVLKGRPALHLLMANIFDRFECNGWRVRKDGSFFWASAIITALKDERGNITGYSKIIRDITELKKTQEQLELFSMQINESNDSIFTVDTEYKITSWNFGAEKLYGYSSGEALGKISNDLLSTDITDKELCLLLDTIERTGHWTGELKRKNKAGDTIYVYCSSSSIRDATGKLTGFIGVSLDITAQKKLQEQVNHLASIVEQSSDAISSTGLDGLITSWNRGAEELFGYKEKEVLGRTANDIGFIKLSEAENIEFFNKLKETGALKYDREYYHKDGTAFFGLATASAIRDKEEKISSLVFMIKDTSERKKLENELKRSNELLEQKVKERTAEIYQSERRFRALIENNHSIITLFDEHAKPIYRSPTGERITGWTDDERMTISLLDLAHPDDAEEFAALMKNIMQNPGKPFFYTTRSRHKDGHYLWLEGVATNMLHDPAVGGIISNLLDITERKNNEEAIKRTEILYSNLFENLLHGFAYCKAIFTDGVFTDFIYLTVNSAYETMTGFKNASGKKVSEVMPGLFESQPEYTKIMGNVARTGRAEKFEAEVKPLGKWYSVSVYSPEKEYFIMLSDDITERKQTEEDIRKSEVLYRSLFQNMLHGFAWCRPIFEDGKLTDFIYLAVNAKYELLTGLKNITGKKLSVIMPGLLQSDPAFADRITRVLSTGNPETFESHIEMLDKWYISSVYSPDRESFVFLGDDISERKLSEQKIIKLNEELEERVSVRTEQLKKTNEELEAFSYSVSHDLRAPLRIIMGFTSVLEEDYGSQLDDEARRIIGVVKNNTSRMGLLIDDLLSFSRMSRQDIIKTGFDTAEMVQEIIEELEQQNSKGPDTKWVVHPLPPVKADMNTMRQVWVNLISNAVKYSGKIAAPRIEIGSFTRETDIVFFVKDNGIGFDEKYAHKLFRVFQRLHSQDEFEGSGIGLAIVEKIISKHNGKVWAEATVNEGAGFFFSLPAGVNTNNINNEIYQQ